MQWLRSSKWLRCREEHHNRTRLRQLIASHLRLGGVAAQALPVLHVPALNQVLHDVAVVVGVVHCWGWAGRGGGRGGRQGG